MSSIILEGPGRAQLVVRVQRFATILAAVLLRPRLFFEQYWRAVQQERRGAAASGAPKPFEFLGWAVALGALFTPFHQMLLAAGGFPEVWLDIAGMDAREMAERYQAVSGRSITVLDFGALTGFPPLDEAIGDLVTIARYGLLAVLFWAFSGFRLPVRLMAAYYAFVTGACLVLQQAFTLAGDLVFLAGAGFGAMSLVQTLGSVPALIYLFVLPAVILPGLLCVPRRLVLRATVFAVLVWGAAGLLLAQLMMSSGVILLGFGL